MNSKLASGGLLCAALLTGCSGSPQLTLPTGKWEELNIPSHPRQSSGFSQIAAPTSGTSALPAAPVTADKAPVSAAKPPLTSLPAPNPQVQPSAAKVGEKPTKAVTAPSVTANASAAPKLPETSTTAPAKSFPAVPAAPVVTVVAPEAKPIKPPPVPKPVWDARAGETLRSVITRWSQKAGYHADWQAQGLDYPIEAPLRFEGSFEESVINIFKLYDTAERPFCVDGRRGQLRLNISENTNPATQCSRPSP